MISMDENDPVKRCSRMRHAFVLLLLVAVLAAPPAQAQLGGLGLPQVPDVGSVNTQTPDLGETLDQTPLQDLHRLRPRQKFLRQRREIEPLTS
jgi:hypothetical protein